MKITGKKMQMLNRPGWQREIKGRSSEAKNRDKRESPISNNSNKARCENELASNTERYFIYQT